jgi:hypothetical protein
MPIRKNCEVCNFEMRLPPSVAPTKRWCPIKCRDVGNFAKPKVRLRLLELQAQVAAQSITAAALTLDAQMEMLRDKADQRGQTSAAIRAEELRGQLNRFYVNKSRRATRAILAHEHRGAARVRVRKAAAEGPGRSQALTLNGRYRKSVAMGGVNERHQSLGPYWPRP